MVSSAPALLETNGWLEGGALDWELKESWETSWRKRGREGEGEVVEKQRRKVRGERDRKREKERKRKRNS